MKIFDTLTYVFIIIYILSFGILQVESKLDKSKCYSEEYCNDLTIESSQYKVKYKNCKDSHPKCSLFLEQNYCNTKPGLMTASCPKTCKLCHLLDNKVRCQRSFLNISSVPAVKNGELNKLFNNIVIKFSNYNITVMSSSPWLIVFNNFLSKAEIKALLLTASNNGQSWERSTEPGMTNDYGETSRLILKSRTSSNTWCNEKCESNPLVQRITSKIAEVVNVSRNNFETYQVSYVHISR
jgi:hypothetical protein